MGIFIKGKIVDFLILATLAGATWLAIYMAKKGKAREIRPISGLDAVYEGVRRSAEMGRPVFMTAGFGGVGSGQIAAGLAMLEVVATQCATLDVPLLTTFASSQTIAAAEKIVSEVYEREGKQEEYSPGKQVIFFSGEQYAWCAGLGSMMQRERPACNVYLGTFFSEALYTGECGSRVGALQIAGSTQQLALPLLAMTMDHLMIGEEIYAAAAKITEDPIQMGSIAAQDVGKAIIFILAITGVIAKMMGLDVIVKLLGY